MSLFSVAAFWEERNRSRVLLLSSAMLVGIALVDWRTEPYISLGFLYLFPIMLTARFLPRWAVVVLALFCAALSELFSSLDPAEAFIRLGFEALALAGCGLFVAELVRNRQLTRETEERLRILVETSPAAIVTVDERGFIERANHAAAELMVPPAGSLVGSRSRRSFRSCITLCGRTKGRSFGLLCNAVETAATAILFWRRSGSPLIRRGLCPNSQPSSRMLPMIVPRSIPIPLPPIQRNAAL